MAGEWRQVTLRDVAEINPDAIGGAWRHTHIRYVDISSVGEGVLTEPPKVISRADAPSRAKRLVRDGDTIISTVRPSRRSMFFVSNVEPDLVVSTGFAVLRPKPGAIHPRYLYACVFDKGFTDYLVSREKGAAYPAVLPEDIAEATINLPPLPEQRAIAHILGTLDDKIELNRKQNETLESMARALFKAWFVDFEPVRAKQCRGGPSWPPPVGQAQGPAPTGWQWPQHILDLFPDRLVESELGEIPEGWETVPASTLIEFNPSEPLRKETEAPYIEMAALPTSGSWPESPVLRPFGSGMRFRNGDTLLARITPCLENGKTAFVQCLPDNTVGWGSTEYIVMRPKHPVPKEFGYLLARDAAFREQAIRSMTGTSGRQRVQADSVAAFKLAAPLKEDDWNAFSRVVAPAFISIKTNAEAIVTLAQLRDTLLPKLISGELRVKDAEAFLKGRGL